MPTSHAASVLRYPGSFLDDGRSFHVAKRLHLLYDKSNLQREILRLRIQEPHTFVSTKCCVNLSEDVNVRSGCFAMKAVGNRDGNAG